MTKQSCSSVPIPPSGQQADAVDKLRLLRSRRVGVATYRRLLAEHGSSKAALAALPEIARAAGVDDYQVFSAHEAQAELKAGQKLGAQLIVEGTDPYPPSLNDIKDAPPLFWSIGNPEVLRRPMVAIVGARNASSLGMRMAKRLAKDLGTVGFVVVSGLARGIDRGAHEGALDTGTIAVMAGGVDQIYPSEHTPLAKEIQIGGLRIAEMPLGTSPQARHFPARNRIIAGLAQAIIVVEAAAKSGSLITATNALDYGREVMAVPGHPFDARGWGCNTLIRDGAVLVRGIDDVLEVLQQPTQAEKSQSNVSTNDGSGDRVKSKPMLQQAVLDRLSPTPVCEDQLLRDVQASTTEVTPILVDLELEGKVVRSAGGMVARTY